MDLKETGKKLKPFAPVLSVAVVASCVAGTLSGYQPPVYAAQEQSETVKDETEKAEILGRIKGKYTIQRSKGLGENEPDMMWMTTMNPETRRLIKVNPEEAHATARMFDLLLGKDLEGRKEFITENGYRYLDAADVS